MSVTIQCPHCHKSLVLQEVSADAVAEFQCPFCGKVFQIGHEPDETGGTTTTGASGASGAMASGLRDTVGHMPSSAQVGLPSGAASSTESTPNDPSTSGEPGASAAGHSTEVAVADGTNVSSVLTGAIGLVVTVLLYLVVLRPLQDTHAGTLLVKRGWIPYAITFLAAWSVTILLFKWIKLRRQKASLLLPIIPEQVGTRITRHNAPLFSDHVRKLLTRRPQSFLLRRILQGLDHLQSRQNAQEVTAFLESQSCIDATAVESSYSLLRVFIWTIPILGFIGTVMGIGQAVGGFSGAIGTAQDLEVIKSSLASVTTGLAVAFDTTLLALVVSVLLMFPVNSLQKAEEDVLSQVDQYCNEYFVRRLDDEGATPLSRETVEQAVASGLAKHAAELDVWQARLESAGETITRQVVSGLETVHRQLQDDYQQHMQQAQALLEASGQERAALVTQTREVQEAQTRQLASLLSAMSETAQRIQGQIGALQESQVQHFQDVVVDLAERLDGLQRQMVSKQEAELADQHQLAARCINKWHDLLEQAAHHQDEIRSRLDALVTAVAEQSRQAAQGMLTARQTHAELAESAREQTAAARQEARTFVDELLGRLSEAVQTTVRSLGTSIETAHRVEQQAAAKTAAEHLAHITAVGNGLIASLVSSQRQLDAHLAAFIGIMENQGTLTAVQSSLASNLELLGSSDAFRRTLTGIDRNLVRLHAVLEGVRERAGLIWPEEGTDGAVVRGRRSLWQRLTGGDAHG